MRLLFVSMTTIGGSGRSQRELATQLTMRGHDVLFLVADERPRRVVGGTRWVYDHLSDLSVRLEGVPAAGAVAWVRDAMGRRTVGGDEEGLRHLFSILPQNALPAVMSDFGPDAVVVSSVDRWTWRLIQTLCSAAEVPTVLYIREDDSLDHLDTGALPTALVANAESLADTLRKRGFSCAFIPSVIDTSVTSTRSSREVAFAINPVPSRGSELIWAVAARLPDIPFAVQESWPLDQGQRAQVGERLAGLRNVEFRSRADPGPSLYADARVLLVPYRVDNRPRVILEAQSNGIPVIAGDVPALIEAIGDGGVIVPLDSVDAWADAIRAVWDDEARYAELVTAALTQARRPGVDPAHVAGEFERLVGQLSTERI